jgi:16S rRNA (cytosine967-C5)-methyltransferase
LAAVKRTRPAERPRGGPGRAREEALRILLRVSEEGAWASRLLESLDDAEIDPRDVALTHEIVLGVLRWRGLIDHHLSGLTDRPAQELDPPVRESLRMGVYQMLLLDRVPAYAAVGGSVELAKRAAGRGAAGLVNAVLRRLSRDPELGLLREDLRALRPEAGARQGQPPDARPGVRGRGLARLASELSHPDWMVARALRRYGEVEGRALLFANCSPPPLVLRPNPLHPASRDLARLLLEQGVATRPGAIAPGALVVTEGRPTRTPLFAEGAFWIQDEASQLVPLLFPAPWSGLTGDLCAAPGGKTLVLATGASPLDPAGSLPADRILAIDLHRHRALRLASSLGRVSPPSVAVIAADIEARAPLPDAVFDRVLLDAPCSGTGVLRRHPEIRWRLTRERISDLGGLQGRMLDEALRLVRPGGLLLYSVCSLEPEEGDEVVDRFLSRSGATIVDPRPGGPPILRELVGEDRRLRTSPHRNGTDGFFAALVRKPGPVVG